MRNEQSFTFNGTTFTVCCKPGGRIEISGDNFLAELHRLGFRPGRTDDPVQFEKVLGAVLYERFRNYVTGFYGR
jgi:hypothetical protein